MADETVTGAKVVQLYESNIRQPVEATLRLIADQIEAGDYGAVGTCALVVLGDKMEVFGFGEDSEPCAVAVLLQAGAMRMIRSVERHGRHDPDGD